MTNCIHLSLSEELTRTPPRSAPTSLSAQAWSWWMDPQQLSSSSRVRETGDSPLCPGEASGCRKENHVCGEQGPAKARHFMRVGSTLVACFITWKFRGLMGGKDPLLQKQKGKKAATLLSWSSFWVPGNQTQPTSKMPTFILQDTSSKWLQTSTFHVKSI